MTTAAQQRFLDAGLTIQGVIDLFDAIVKGDINAEIAVSPSVTVPSIARAIFLVQALNANVYLGVKASDPILDNLGNPLINGAIYINATTGFKIYNGSTWKFLQDYNPAYLGVQASNPTVDNLGHPVQPGAFYVNTTNGVRFFLGGVWVSPSADAEASAVNAATSATQAAISALAADASADLALIYERQALAAANATGPAVIFDTKAAANAALAGLADQTIVEVIADESLLAPETGSRTRYRKSGGVYVFLVNLDQLRTDLANPATGFGASLVANADRSIATIAALYAFPNPALIAGQTLVFSVLEYSSGTGVGGGSFRWDASSSAADNAGTVINPTANVGAGRWIRIYSGAVDVTWFGAVGDGVANDTSAIVLANAASKDLLFADGKTYNLINWEPLTGTVIHAHGAKIQRHSTAFFGPTTSSAAIVATNDNVSIYGGKWTDKPGLGTAVWSGSIVVNGGDNWSVQGCEFYGTWGGIIGHHLQNGVLMSANFSILDCIIHDCSHNTYLADIDGLTFSRNRSYDSLRDGFRTYRNCLNIIITENLIYNNGDGSPGQSQDGIDTYIAGRRCVIANNIIYGNTVRGIDIKRASADIAEINFDAEYIISNNFIFSNLDIGISIQDFENTENLPNVTVTGNHVYSNGLVGIYFLNCLRGIAALNQIYSNGHDGIRVVGSNYITVLGNNLYDNGKLLLAGYRNGIYSASSTNTVITDNTVTSATGTQISGIFTDNGICHDNISTGHSSANYSSVGNMLVTGKVLRAPFVNNTLTQLISVAPIGALSGLRTSFNSTAAAIDIAISKRNATTGAFGVNISSEAAAVIPTAYVANVRALSGLGSTRSINGGEALTITLGNISSAFTQGIVEFHYID